MTFDDERQLAMNALEVLRLARSVDGAKALTAIKKLAALVAEELEEQPERASAWLAVCRVRKTLSENPSSPELAIHLDAASDLTKEWLAAIK